MKQLIFIFILFLHFTLFAQSPELIFHSGFEPNTSTIDESSGSVDIIGIDASVSAPNDWENDLEDHPNIGTFKVQYQGGDSTMRLAEIAQDPLNASNNTLWFWIKEPNVGDIKGRVQANLYESDAGIKKLFYSARLYLPADFNVVKNAPFDFDWLTLAEFWNNANWTGEDNIFRMKIDLKKVAESPDSLRVRAAAQAYNTQNNNWSDDVWEYTNPDFLVPVQKWMTFKMYFIEGDACNGRFILTITPDGEEETVVHDITNFTHHPSDPDPDGLKHFNPMKLYTSDDVIDYVTGAGGLLNVHWDDFEIWKDSTLVTEDNCLQGGITFETQEQIDNFASEYSSCKKINGDLIIQSNGSNITNLDGLSQLTSINGLLKIQSNPDLISLNGLENLDFRCISALEIIDNTSLAICDEINICNYLEEGGAATITNNATGCNTISELLEQCMYTDNDEDGFDSSVDCNDEDPDINPDAVEIPNNGIDEDCDGMDLVTSIDEAVESDVLIFPNPTKADVTVEMHNSENTHLKIYDYTGRLLIEQSFRDNTNINLSSFSKGVYIMMIKTEDSIYMKKLSKF